MTIIAEQQLPEDFAASEVQGNWNGREAAATATLARKRWTSRLTEAAAVGSRLRAEEGNEDQRRVGGEAAAVKPRPQRRRGIEGRRRRQGWHYGLFTRRLHRSPRSWYRLRRSSWSKGCVQRQAQAVQSYGAFTDGSVASAVSANDAPRAPFAGLITSGSRLLSKRLDDASAEMVQLDGGGRRPRGVRWGR